MGRPAVNTALNHTFDPNDTTKGAAKDAYNADNAQAGWAKYTPEHAGNLALFDGLDDGLRQPVPREPGRRRQDSDQPDKSTARSPASRRTTASGSTRQPPAATTYLAVEGTYAATAGLIPSALTMPNDCGGRTLSYDVIDITYSAVATGGIGTPGALTTVSDGVTADATKTAAAAFPFLAPPTQ